MSTKPESRPPAKSTPEIEPARGSPPKRFPQNPEPLASRQEAAAEKEQAAARKRQDSEASATRLGSGEDPGVESGLDKNDPEQPAASDDEIEKSFE